VRGVTPFSLLKEGLIHYGIEHTPEQLAKLSLFVEELLKWNKRLNLVGLKEREPIVLELIYDAFFLHTRISDMGPVLDLGSGSGVVAVPLAILDEERHIFSVDKSLKKIQFQNHVKRTVRLACLDVLHGRVEEIPPLHAKTVVCKAFGSIEQVLKEARRHVDENGHVFLVKGSKEKATEQEGFFLKEVSPYRLPKSKKEYQLFVYKKISHGAVLC
jgi:16S rRNA (guanine527-N7)-methyltransferase